MAIYFTDTGRIPGQILGRPGRTLDLFGGNTVAIDMLNGAPAGPAAGRPGRPEPHFNLQIGLDMGLLGFQIRRSWAKDHQKHKRSTAKAKQKPRKARRSNILQGCSA